MGDHGYRWGGEKGRPAGVDGWSGWQAKGFGGLCKHSGKVRCGQRGRLEMDIWEIGEAEGVMVTVGDRAGPE